MNIYVVLNLYFYPSIADTNSKYPICLYDLYWGAIRHV